MSDLIRERPVLTPTQLNTLARDLLEGSFAQVWVAGEISNFSRPASGHAYFTLKDERAQVRCALFRQKAAYLRFAPRNGLQVLVRGRLTVYEARGDYQLVLEHMEEAGEGALRRAFEELKAKLAGEGLFAPERKRPLPRFVRRLGVITSPSGAAVRDVLSVIGRRFPLLEVDVLPVPVQGDGAAAEIRTMLARAQASGRYDALLLTRGGGSLEDLWSFNDEALTREVAATTVPIVSAVGHEIDFSLADFAADLRAPTPSAAAELLAPDRGELLARLRQLRQRLDAGLARHQVGLAQRCDQALLRLQAQRPQLRLERAALRLLPLRRRLDAAFAQDQARRRQRSRDAAAVLERLHPRTRLAASRQRADWLRQRLETAAARRLESAAQRLGSTLRALAAVSPLATLARGYAIVQDEHGRVLTDAAQVRAGDRVRARLAQGQLQLQVIPEKAD